MFRATVSDYQQKPFIIIIIMFRATVPATLVINRVSNFWSGHFGHK